MREAIAMTEEETLKQKYIITQLNGVLADKKYKYFITTYGCQMNAHDSEKLKGILEQIGYSEADHEECADFILYNTCCVRENAEQKVYGRLGYLKHLKEKNPNLMIAICGCMMQQNHVIKKIKQVYKHVDIVFGTHNIYKLAELIQLRLETKERVFDIWQKHGEIVEDLPTIRNHPYKASVNIMFGCNNFCTFCIVPHVRGRERSRQKKDIINEVKRLVADGVIEIMLLGQNVNSYGKTLDEPITFARLLQEIEQIEGLERIRFMTSHPKDLSDELIETIGQSKKICNALHLPFQSGSSRLLKKMNRGYTKEDYMTLVEKIKRVRPTIALTTDIIVGFPSETEDDFQETLDLVKRVGFDNAFTFIYSKRTGTPAAKMDEQVPEAVTKERFNRLLDAVKPIANRNNQERVGKVFNVLVEMKNRQDEHLVTGRLSSNTLVHFKGSEELIGEIVSVKIVKAMSFYLMGEQVMP